MVGLSAPIVAIVTALGRRVSLVGKKTSLKRSFFNRPDVITTGGSTGEGLLTDLKIELNNLVI
jgi:hypothetical protein